MHKIVSSKKAPAAIGSYSQAILSNGFLFSSGQLGIDPITNQLVNGDASDQARQAMKNIGSVLGEAGMIYKDIVKTTIFLKSMQDFAQVNEVYGTFFKDVYPARSCFAVQGLPKNALVEIEIVASKG